MTSNLLPYRWWICLPGMLLVALVLFIAQANAQIVLESIKPLRGDPPQIEIVTSAPVIPNIQQMDGPPRLVIDFPNTEFRGNPKRISVENGAIHTIRVDQYAASPPMARVVVDLTEAIPYGTQTQGSRLLITFSATAAKSVTVPSGVALPAPLPLGQVTFSGTAVPPGSAVTAGSDSGVLRLARGGEIRICPGTTVSVTPSPNGHDMLLGMNTGTIELHYGITSSSPTSADSLMTPDFRMVLGGPGRFDVAVNADSRGNTCVRTLPGNTASISVSELMGDGTYEVKPTEQVTFRAGQIREADNKVPATCGCRAPLPPMATQGPEMQPLPPSKPDDVHVAVDAPFVFNANAPRTNMETALGPEVRDSEALPVVALVRIAPLQDVVIPPAVVTPPSKHSKTPTNNGLFGKIRHFFGAIFR